MLTARFAPGQGLACHVASRPGIARPQWHRRAPHHPGPGGAVVGDPPFAGSRAAARRAHRRLLRRGRRHGRLLRRVPASQHAPAALRRGEPHGRLRPGVRRRPGEGGRRAGPRGGAPGLHPAGGGPGRRYGAGDRRGAPPGAADGLGIPAGSPEVRPHRDADPHRLPLHRVHRAHRPRRRHAQRPRGLRLPGPGSRRPQPGDDRVCARPLPLDLAADPEPWVRGAARGTAPVGPPVAGPAQDGLPVPSGGGVGRSGHREDPAADGADRLRSGRLPDQPPGLHVSGLLAARRQRLVPLLRRPALRTAPRGVRGVAGDGEPAEPEPSRRPRRHRRVPKHPGRDLADDRLRDPPGNRRTGDPGRADPVGAAPAGSLRRGHGAGHRPGAGRLRPGAPARRRACAWWRRRSTR